LDILAGELPKRASSHVQEWAKEHIEELKLNWENIINEVPINKIKPLE